jgi:aminoglycoside phosphotransferase (APT) family kinase protein
MHMVALYTVWHNFVKQHKTLKNALGAPYIIMERLPGRIFLVWEPHSSFSRDTAQLREVWLQAARMLARLHMVDWQNGRTPIKRSRWRSQARRLASGVAKGAGLPFGPRPSQRSSS